MNRDFRLYAKYRVGGHTSEMIFAPVQAVDEKLFPDRWEVEWLVRLRKQIKKHFEDEGIR